MSIEVRPITPDELPAWREVNVRAFGRTPSERDVPLLAEILEFPRVLAAFDGREIVATTNLEDAPVTVPGARSVRCAGVTRVSVAATHRRRGILTRIMQTQLRSIRDTGEPLAALWASESPIYGRFGYGVATIAEEWTLDRRDVRFLPEVPPAGGTISYADMEEVRTTFPAVFNAYAAGRVGGMPRLPFRWRYWTEDQPEWRGGFSPLYAVGHRDEAARLDGYAMYRLKPQWPGNVPQYELHVEEVVALDAAVEASLWRYLAGVDLVGPITVADQATDAALPWMLADPRRLSRRPIDGLYLAIVDVEAALGARTYPAAGRLVLDVRAAFCDWVAGRYALEAGPEGAQVTRTDAEADLALNPATLATLYLGTAQASVLARAGKIEERRDGAIALADELFRGPHAPWCINHF